MYIIFEKKTLFFLKLFFTKLFFFIKRFHLSQFCCKYYFLSKNMLQLTFYFLTKKISSHRVYSYVFFVIHVQRSRSHLLILDRANKFIHTCISNTSLHVGKLDYHCSLSCHALCQHIRVKMEFTQSHLMKIVCNN